MLCFSIRDLRTRIGELVGAAESGELAVVTKHGRPVFVAVPVSDRLLEAGVYQALAIQLYDEGALSLSRAARLAGESMERFVEILKAAGVEVVLPTPEELENELGGLT